MSEVLIFLFFFEKTKVQHMPLLDSVTQVKMPIDFDNVLF